jgi:voltage-gated potassium channel
MYSLLSRKHITEKDNFSYLLFSLFSLLISSATVDQFFVHSLLGQSLVIAFTVISMSIALWTLYSSKYAFNTALGLVFATIIISAVVILLNQAELAFIHRLLVLYFFLMLLRIASQQAIFADRVTLNSIIGSICIFLLLGLIGASWQENFPDFINFSIFTLTTLGFSDLLPINPLARFLVYTEAIVGVFYMAIVVSSLVSSGTVHNQEKAVSCVL